MTRRLYRLLLRMHPRGFREKFEEEMLGVFDALRERRSSAALLGDGARSLGRQWFIGRGLWKAPVAITLAALPILTLLEVKGKHLKRWQAGYERPPATCEWSGDHSRGLDLQDRPDQLHLTSDALLAEELAIRYATRSRGPRSGRFDGFDVYRAASEHCAELLFAQIAEQHGVTTVEVRHWLTERRLGSDVAVFGSFGLAYVLVAFAVARRIRRRFGPAQGRLPPAGIVLAASLMLALAGVLVGEHFSRTVEARRLGTTHLSGRVARIPWVQHRGEIFAVGVCIFWIAAWRCRADEVEDDRIRPAPLGLLEAIDS